MKLKEKYAVKDSSNRRSCTHVLTVMLSWDSVEENMDRHRWVEAQSSDLKEG
ncbi:MAG: hypothetical protein QMD80_08085 [archaeon]|nr:hypothetical protein [archaeon]MDI6886187.1 hypothetical protein [archaeon]